MADDRKTKLDLTISSVTPERLEQTRQEVGAEVQKLTTSNKPPPVSSNKPPPEQPSEPPEEAPVSEATERMQKLDLIQDVQLILVDKYRQGAKILWVAIGLISLSFISLSWLLVRNFELHNRIAALQADQEKLVERGAQIERKTDETSAKVDATKAKVDETNAKVDQAVEAAPKIEIDDAGKAKVVVPIIKTSTPISKKPPKPPASTSSATAPPAASSAPLPPSLPVEAKKL